GAQQTLYTLEIRLEVAAPQELVHRRLRHEGRRDVRRDGERLDLRRELLRQDEVADAHARRDRLRERRRVRDMVAALQLEDRRRRLALVAHEPVRILLEPEPVMLAGELRDALSPLGRKRAA